jgi:hypothetical protein
MEELFFIIKNDFYEVFAYGYSLRMRSNKKLISASQYLFISLKKYNEKVIT